MTYVRKIIGDDERLLALTRPHWIYLFEGVFWGVGLTVLGLVFDHYFYKYVGAKTYGFSMDLWLVKFDEMHTPFPWIFGFTGFTVFLPLFLGYVSTEVGLTHDRIIHKKGVIFIEIEQVDLDDIKAEHISHGWFGWLLGYGRIRLDCRFVDDVWLPAIRNPYKLLKLAHAARVKRPGATYDANVLDGKLRDIDQRRSEATARHKIKNLGRLIKASFSKAS